MQVKILFENVFTEIVYALSKCMQEIKKVLCLKMEKTDSEENENNFNLPKRRQRNNICNTSE